MASNEGMQRIDPSSPVYQEVARLYRISQEMRPGGKDLWNGELYARSDDKWGGLGRDGTLRLNQDLVLNHLTGGELSHDPQMQGQALSTVLHESLHARVEVDAPNEPNALRRAESIGLDEGLTELTASEDFQEFAQRAGYEGVPQPEPEYSGAVHATNELLSRATTSETQRTELLSTALDQPVVMRWDTIADSIVRNELADVVPPDAQHQQAARAHLVGRMAEPMWDGVQHRSDRGQMVADLTNDNLDTAVGQIREHYQQNPGEPFPAKVPNPAAAVTTQIDNQGERQRTVTADLANLPPPAAGTRLDGPAVSEAARPGSQDGQSSTQQGSQEGRQGADRGGQDVSLRFLSGQAPAAGATRYAPSLGDGARGRSGTEATNPSRTATHQGPAGGRG